MANTTRRGRPTREEFLADVERGILDDRFDEFMPLEQYGPPTKGSGPPRAAPTGGPAKTRQTAGRRVPPRLSNAGAAPPTRKPDVYPGPAMGPPLGA